MKLTKLTSAALALALTAALGTAAQANAVYTTGDLLLGFEQSGAANNYVVDLGAVSQFINASGTLSFQLSTSDLGGDFGGTSWSNNDSQGGTVPLVQWGVIAGSDKNNPATIGGVTLQANTIFYTQGRLDVATQTAVPSQNANTQASINGNTGFNGLEKGSGGFNNHVLAAGSIAGQQAVNIAASGGNSWSHFSPGLTAFNIGSSIEQPGAGSYTGPTNSVLDLYEFQNTSATNLPGTYLGYFSLSSGGLLSFTPGAVPEPSTYALMAIGLGLLFLLQRRKAASNL